MGADITTEHLVLRALALEEMRDARECASAHAEYPPEGTLIGFRVRGERRARGEAQGPWFRIVLRDGGVAIGDLNFHDPPDQRGEVVVGMDLVPAMRGRGLGTEALAAACAWALGQPGVRLVRGEIRVDNGASRRMAEKAGMGFVEVIGDEAVYRVRRQGDGGEVWQ